MTLEVFARVHDLSARWLELRMACESIVARPDFWYQLVFRKRPGSWPSKLPISSLRHSRARERHGRQDSPLRD
jgi:hypothetical protein